MINDNRQLLVRALAWCESVLGPITLLSDHSKAHGGHESLTRRIQTGEGIAYLKVHDNELYWQREVHAYEQWVPVFGEYAPRLLAVGDKDPLALVISELPGRILETVSLSPATEQAIWRRAGAALSALHALGPGERFGTPRRDGGMNADCLSAAEQYVRQRFGALITGAKRAGYLSPAELATVEAAWERVPFFTGERPFPCHRDYCAANWLVDTHNQWCGVIDFEFAHWDVRVADFSRDPHWNWIHRPDLPAAFGEGYGRVFTDAEEQQLLVARAEYAVGAIMWGNEHAFYGFAREGHEALAHLASLLG